MSNKKETPGYEDDNYMEDSKKEEVLEKYYDKTKQGVEPQIKDTIQQWIQQSAPKLELVNKKLYDLTALSGKIWDNLVEVDLRKNNLSSIDILNQFRNIKIIDASNNYIKETNLNLQKLEQLNLQNNYIAKFPLLHQLPRIKILNLNSNQITEIKLEFRPPSSLSLISLDIGNNLLEFPAEFDSFLTNFKKLKNLTNLVMSGNKKLEEKSNDQSNKFATIVSSLPLLETFNHDRAEEYRKQVLEEEKKQKELNKDKKKGAKGKARVDKGQFYFPTMEVLCYNLEAANSHPSYALDHLKDLAQDVDKIQEHLEMVDEYFGKQKNETEIKEMIETFMQNAQMLIDNHFELQTIMLSILSKLSIVKFYDFGIRCFNTLQDLMIAGKDMEQRCIDVLRKEVINKLFQQNPENIPISLLEGLQELVHKTEKSDMLVGLFENCFPQWLRILRDRINACKKISTIYENNSHMDCIMQLLAAAVKDNQTNIDKAIQKELVEILVDIVNESHFEQNRYIPVLNVVHFISQKSQQAANKFVDKGVHSNIMKNIRSSMHIYKKNNDLRDEEAKDTDVVLKKKYLTLAAEIDCLGGMLEADKKQRSYILNDPLIDDLLVICSHYKTDPVLLTSICKFAKQVFTREEMRTNQSVIEPKIEKMQQLKHLIPYLGMKKYPDLLAMTKKYYDNSNFAAKEKLTSIQHLDDEVAHNLFISIINLINFFCEESEKENSISIFETVSQALNEHNREQALFNCLQVPNDEVKLAVVECLNNVPLSEFDTEEIATIIKLLSSYKNIGAGKTELVLAKIFWILAKMTKEKEADCGKNFRIKFGEKALNEAMEIMIRNQMREVDDVDEGQEKLALTLSILNFMKFASTSNDLKRCMLNKHDQLKKVLHAEEQFTHKELVKYPVDIERTSYGSTIDVLHHAVNSNESISPFNYVSFRVMQRMADILMNHLDIENVDPYKAGQDVIQTLMDEYADNFKRRKKQERTYWDEPPEDFLEKLKENKDQMEAFESQHHQFTSSNCISILRMFLTKKVPEFEAYLKRKYDPQYDKANIVIQNELKQIKDKAEQKELDKQLQDQEKKQKPLQEAIIEESKEEGLNILRLALQQEELGRGFNEMQNQDGMNKGSKAKNKNIENIDKRDYHDGVQNKKMRGLCVAAYLRCLFAAIEYAPKQQYKQEAITALKEQFVFRAITQLCDTTEWQEANIGAKYLRVMRHVIKTPQNSAQEIHANIDYYEIISIVIKKLLAIISDKIKNEQSSPLTNEDKIMIYEISATCSLMAQQCSLFCWSEMQVKEQGSHARSRRTPQEKCIDKQMSMLFPAQSIFTFINILFRDMKYAKKLFDKNASKEGQNIEKKDIKFKNDLAREHIKMFIGEYLSKCAGNKYDILEAIMKGIVFDQHDMRETFLQEILKALEEGAYRVAIEHYLFEHQMGFEPAEKERIIFCQWADMALEGQSAHQRRLLCLTNKGVHLMRPPSSKPCSVCPPESLCPVGPTVDIKFKYEAIKQLIQFPELMQKVVISFENAAKREQMISVIIPQWFSAYTFRVMMIEIMNGQNIVHDKFISYTLKNKYLKEEQLKHAQYVSYNPSTGIFGWFGTENVIQNCHLLLVTNQTFYMIKENWNKWCNFESSDLEQYFNKNNDQQDQPPGGQNAKEKVQKRQEIQKIQNAENSIFTDQLKKPLAELKKIHIYNGKDPIVEIQLNKDSTEKLIFMSDYDRQQFVEELIKINKEKAS